MSIKNKRIFIYTLSFLLLLNICSIFSSNTIALAESNNTIEASVLEYLRNAVPEVKEKFAANNHFIAAIEGYPEMNSNDPITKNYYRIYTGYMMETHQVVWNRFAVKADFTDIRWYDVVNDEYYSLEVWRANEKTRN